MAAIAGTPGHLVVHAHVVDKLAGDYELSAEQRERLKQLLAESNPHASAERSISAITPLNSAG